MGVEGNKIIDIAALSDVAAETDLLTEDIDFSKDTPADLLRKIEINLELSVAVVIEATLDGSVFRPLNNGNTLIGFHTIVFYVKNDTIFNLQTATGSAAINGSVIIAN